MEVARCTSFCVNYVRKLRNSYIVRIRVSNKDFTFINLRPSKMSIEACSDNTRLIYIFGRIGGENGSCSQLFLKKKTLNIVISITFLFISYFLFLTFLILKDLRNPKQQLLCFVLCIIPYSRNLIILFRKYFFIYDAKEKLLWVEYGNQTGVFCRDIQFERLHFFYCICSLIKRLLLRTCFFVESI